MNEEVKETIKILQNNSLVKSGSYEFIGDSDITYAEIYILLKFIEDLQQENQKYKEVIDKVRNIAYEYGQIDGAHHKTWVIDQIIRELLGTEYDNFIKEYEEDGEYTWDIGIAP